MVDMIPITPEMMGAVNIAHKRVKELFRVWASYPGLTDMDLNMLMVSIYLQGVEDGQRAEARRENHARKPIAGNPNAADTDI